MRVNHRTLARLFLLLALACAVAASGAAEQGLPTHNRIAELVVSATRIDWLPAGDSAHLVLTVAGPAGIWDRKEFAEGQPVSLSLSDPEWEHLPDGTYTWELRAISPPGKLPGRSLVESGHFFVKDGSFVAARKKAPAGPSRPPRIITAESHINDHLSVTGNVCIGTSCTSADPDPNLPSLILKAPQPNILFDDDFVEGGSSPHDWALFINPSTAAEFSIADFENGLIPFTIAGGAPNSSLYVAGDGKLGLGTSTPGAKLHLFNNTDVFTVLLVENTSSGVNAVGTLRTQSNTAAATIQAHGSGRIISRFGQPLASWAELLQSDGNGLIIGTLSNKPLILGTNSANRLHITGSGNIGIGTTSPAHPLHISRSDGTAKVLIEETSGTAASRELLELKNPGGAAMILDDTNDATRWSTIAFGSQYLINNQANAGVEVTISSTGNVTIAGTLTQGSDRSTKTDVVPVQPAEVLAKLVSLPISTWSRKDDESRVRHLGPMAQDFSASFGLGEDNRHISTLDMAGVSMASIQALHGMMAKAIAEKDAEIAALRQRLAALEELVSKLAVPQ